MISRLIHKLVKQGVELKLREDKLVVEAISGTLTPSLIEEIKKNKNEIINILKLRSKKSKFYNIEIAQFKDYYSLSSAQKRLYILQQMDLGSTVYNMPNVISLEPGFDKGKIENVFHQLISRHDSLRTCFEVIGEEPVQCIHKKVNFEVKEFTVEKIEINKYRNKFTQAFDLSKAPLFKVAIIQNHSEGAFLMIDMHHIISDGTSHAILEKEFKSLYSGEIIPPLKLQYKDFSEWQNSKAQKEKIKDQKNYWLKKFKGEIPVLNLPTDFPRPAILSYEGASVSFALSKEETKIIKLFSKENGLTTYMSVLLVFKILLSKLSGQDDIIIGAAIAGRNHSDLENIVGMFVNLLAIRNKIKGSECLKDFAAKLKQTTLEAYENQNYQFDDLVNQLSIERNTSRNPIFDVAFDLLNQEEYTGSLERLNSEELVHISASSKFDLALTAVNYPEQILLNLTYCTKLFKEETIERYIKYFKQIINQISDKLGKDISEIEIISIQEKQQLLFEFNNTKADYPKDKLIHQLFEEEVNRVQDNIALVFENNQITYKELNRRSNQLARILRKKGVSPNTIVGLLLDRSIEVLISIFGILKAGGAYLPIDPEYPVNRIDYVLEDSRIQILLSNTDFVNKKIFMDIQENKNTNVNIYKTETRSQITDLDKLPFPDRSLVNYEKYNQYIGLAMVKNTIAIQGTRGCPYGCVYCHKIWPKKHVVRSAENIFSELLLYYKMGVKRFVIIDDIFNLDKENSILFFNLIIENGLKIQLIFSNGVRGDILTKEYIDLMIRAGTVSLGLALETASPRLQKLIKKNLNLDKLRDNIEYICKKYPHVIIELNTMHGFPTETEEEAMLTLDFINSIKWIHFPYVHILKIFANTDMANLAIENGIPEEAIDISSNLAYHEIPETLPFNKSFTLKYQADFFSGYFLSKERLLHVLPLQMKIMTEDELIQKYNSYLPIDVKSFKDILDFVKIDKDELNGPEFLEEALISVPDINKKLLKHFPVNKARIGALNVLLLDLSQFFSNDDNMLYDVIEPPLGLMYIMTYLNQQLGGNINGKIIKSRVDFDNYKELKKILDDFKPDVIGIRTLSFYKDFFHKTVSIIKHWGFKATIIAGGPYATSDYNALLKDTNIDITVLGEGEITFCQLIESIINNGKRLPGIDELKNIEGIAFVPKKNRPIQKLSREIVLLDILEDSFDKEMSTNIELVNVPTDLSYVIYTSGTTGKPKGVMVEHKNVVPLFFNSKFEFEFNEKDVWTMFHSQCFDFSVWEMYGALLYGGKLIIIPKVIARDAVEYYNVLCDEKVTVLNQIPSAFYNLAEVALCKPEKTLKNLKYVILGGDALKPNKLKRWFSVYPDVKLINMYGITETTVYISYKEISEYEIENNIGNIGSSIPTLTTYIMDRELRLVPIGVVGELLIGGDGVSRGYLRREDLTKAKFVMNPYNKEERLFRSGDLVKMIPNGEMEYIGRLDHQVQINGFRVELGEVENILLGHKSIKEAVVIDREENESTYLCAYVVCEGEFSQKEIRNYLSTILPNYMIPTYFTEMDKFPLNASGKVERKALPVSRKTSGDEYIAPSNDLEEKLVKVWANILNINATKIGVETNFFEIGGNSLLIIKVVQEINNTLGYDLKVIDLFKYTTIRELINSINKVKSVDDTNNDRDDEINKGKNSLGKLLVKAKS